MHFGRRTYACALCSDRSFGIGYMRLKKEVGIHIWPLVLVYLCLISHLRLKKSNNQLNAFLTKTIILCTEGRQLFRAIDLSIVCSIQFD
jgi:hypothetical protein